MDKRELAIYYCSEFSRCRPRIAFENFDSTERGIGFILLYLYEHNEEIIAGELAFNLKVSTARIAVLLKKMESKGLIRKHSSPKDGRKTVVEITEYGKENVEKHLEEVYQRMEGLLDEIGEKDVKEFLRITSKINNFMERECSHND